MTTLCSIDTEIGKGLLWAIDTLRRDENDLTLAEDLGRMYEAGYAIVNVLEVRRLIEDICQRNEEDYNKAEARYKAIIATLQSPRP